MYVTIEYPNYLTQPKGEKFELPNGDLNSNFYNRSLVSYDDAPWFCCIATTQ